MELRARYQVPRVWERGQTAFRPWWIKSTGSPEFKPSSTRTQTAFHGPTHHQSYSPSQDTLPLLEPGFSVQQSPATSSRLGFQLALHQHSGKHCSSEACSSLYLSSACCRSHTGHSVRRSQRDRWRPSEPGGVARRALPVVPSRVTKSIAIDVLLFLES